jgi:hypothetical protein
MTDRFERSTRNAYRRNEENMFKLEEAGIDHDTAELIAMTLASARHEFHSNSDDLFNSESGNWDDLEGYLDRFQNGLNAIDGLLGTSYASKIIHIDEWITDADHYYGNELPLDECREIFDDQVSETNNLIESAMLAVDRAYGTDIAPTGTARLLI